MHIFFLAEKCALRISRPFLFFHLNCNEPARIFKTIWSGNTLICTRARKSNSLQT